MQIHIFRLYEWVCFLAFGLRSWLPNLALKTQNSPFWHPAKSPFALRKPMPKCNLGPLQLRALKHTFCPKVNIINHLTIVVWCQWAYYSQIHICRLYVPVLTSLVFFWSMIMCTWSFDIIINSLNRLLVSMELIRQNLQIVPGGVQANSYQIRHKVHSWDHPKLDAPFWKPYYMVK